MSAQSDSCLAPESECSAPGAVSIIEELKKRQGREIIFSTKKNPEQKYCLVVEDYFIADGEILIYIESVPEDVDAIPYAAALACGISVDDYGTLHIRWIITMDYPGIEREIRSLRQIMREPRMSLIDIIGLYSLYGHDPQYKPQMRTLFAYHRSRLPLETDAQVKRYFDQVPDSLRRQGLANALGEFITSFMPPGSKLDVQVYHQESRLLLEDGVPFLQTPNGRRWRKVGYNTLVGTYYNEEADLTGVVLEKTEEPLMETRWQNPEDLGLYCNVPSAVNSDCLWSRQIIEEGESINSIDFTLLPILK